MKKIILLIGFITFSISLLLNSSALADCTNGKTEITIVNPAGKVIEICVPDAAIPGLQTASDNSGTIISAVCPCYTPEDIEMLQLNDCYCANMNSEEDNNGDVVSGGVQVGCGLGPMEVSFSSGVLGWTHTIKKIEGVNEVCIFPAIMIFGPNYCRSLQGNYAVAISVEEAQACFALLNTIPYWSEYY